MNEFQLIQHYFNKHIKQRNDVLLGIGDDAALLSPPHDQALAISTDTLVSGIHFFPDTPPNEIGHQAIAVNLSDLAAMGATPAWVTLALTLPSANEGWLDDFSAGFFGLAEKYDVQLVGGDITHGPLSITVGVYGFVPAAQALKRAAAKAGDLIYVSGTLGLAGMALKQHRIKGAEPRIELGKLLLGIAHAAIDISDGLAADLQHILEDSNVGARINLHHLPCAHHTEEAIQLALTAGDDYELCFTLPPSAKPELEKRCQTLAYPITCIGEITATPGLFLYDHSGNPVKGHIDGYKHF